MEVGVLEDNPCLFCTLCYSILSLTQKKLEEKKNTEISSKKYEGL